MSTPAISDPEKVNRGSTGVPDIATERVRGDGSAPGGRESVGELVGRIVGGVKDLARHETELAKIEMKEAAAQQARTAGAAGAAGLFGLFALAFMAAAATAALTYAIPVWAALLTMCGAFGIAALAALSVAAHFNKKAKSGMSAERTRMTLKETLGWARAQIRR
ncbi:MAG TPA: phage holin family protein [Actinomycetota bacterium]|nr:phage holin family protein [Actinomycetota bacterium]